MRRPRLRGLHDLREQVGRSLRLLWLPPWRRAPLRAWRTPSLFLGVAVAAFVLGVAGASRPMFVASTARASLTRDVEVGCRFDVGFRAERSVAVTPPDSGITAGLPIGPVTQALDAELADVPGIDPLVLSVIGGQAQVFPGGGDGAIAAAGGDAEEVQLIGRTGFLDHIDVVERGDGPGIWLADVSAERLGVGPGDEVTVRPSAAEPRVVPVAGVYRDLRAGRDRHWCSMRWYFEPRSAGGSAPAVVALFDPDELRGLLAAAGVHSAEAWWEYPPDPESWDLPTADAATRELARIVDRANNRITGLGAALGYGPSSADIPRSVRKAERTAASVESVAGPVALGTIGVAVVMLLAAARSWLTRRAQEVTVLSLRGAGPLTLALKATAELLPALVVGTGLGVASAVAVVRAIGPHPRVGDEAVADGLLVVGAALVVALVALTVVVAAGVRRVGVGAGGAAPRRSLPPWEPAVLALAAAALYELRTRDTVVDETHVDGLLLLFPLLLLAGGAGSVAR
ncbi:MAG TPA: hypothetical protein VIL36_14890, partial [Acidimicrobiales bacterium]